MKDKLKKLLKFFKNKEENRDNLNWMVAQAKPYKKLLALMLCLNIFSLLLSLSSTIVGKFVVDKATSSELTIKYIAIMCSATLCSIAFSAGYKIFSDYIGERFSFGLRCNMFESMQRSVWQQLTKFHSGDTVTRLTSDVSSISSGIISIVPSTIVTLLQLILAFGILFYFDRTLALFALFLGPIGAGSAIFFREKYKKYQLQLRESESEYRSFMQENLSNITVVKTFLMENDNNAHMQEIRKKRLKVVMSASRLSAVMSSVMRLVYSLGYVVAFCWGAYRLTLSPEDGGITYGTMTIFISLVSQVQGSINGLAHILPQFYSMVISAKRIREITEIKNEVYDDKINVPESVGIKIDHVDFSYETDKVLSDVCLDIQPGDRVGIIGTSGAGKTTLIRLLLALIEPEKGSLEYIADGVGEPISPSSRRFISYVPQGNTLLSGTIEKNLKVGKPDATQTEMWATLTVADAAEFVSKMPDTLGTSLTEHAGGLSEGQAQRIAIARALLREKPLLILDEATSALDENTESQVLSNITQNSTKTCLIITHRRSMLKYCRKVIEISEDGKVSIREL